MLRLQVTGMAIPQRTTFIVPSTGLFLLRAFNPWHNVNNLWYPASHFDCTPPVLSHLASALSPLTATTSTQVCRLFSLSNTVVSPVAFPFYLIISEIRKSYAVQFYNRTTLFTTSSRRLPYVAYIPLAFLHPNSISYPGRCTPPIQSHRQNI